MDQIDKVETKTGLNIRGIGGVSPELKESYQPERSKREDLDDKRIYNSDGSLHNPICSYCGFRRWNSLHQGCGALNIVVTQ